MLLPIIALSAFIIILIISQFLGSKSETLLYQIENGNFPSLEMNRDLAEIQAKIQRGMQDAVASKDAEMLMETDVFRDSLLSKIEKGKNNPLLDVDDLENMEKAFQKYYNLARDVSEQMIVTDFSEEGFDEEFTKKITSMTEKYNEIDLTIKASTLRGKEEMVEAFTKTRENQGTTMVVTVIVTLFSILLLIVMSVFLVRAVTDPLNKLVNAANKVAEGQYDIIFESTSTDEIGTLANTFSKMTGKIKKSMTEVEQQNWLKSGQSELNEKMRGELDPTQLAQNVITYLAAYLNAWVGTIFLKNENESLDMVGSYAYTKRKSLSNKFKLGEGLVGQSALEKKEILINNIPDNYIKINSSLGETTPFNILVSPFLYEGQVKGVIELGAFDEFSDLHLNFLRQVAENIAIAFHTAESRVELKKLLEESQQQSEELQTQQEELRVTNEELEEQTQALKESEERLKQQQQELKTANGELEEKTISLTERTEEIEKKNSELELARKSIETKAAELEMTSKYKSEFLANMSHELRTPLNSILILSKLLNENKNGNLEKKQIEFANTINSAGKDLLDLINEILDLSKIESGKMVINIEDISIAQFTGYVQQNLKHMAEEKGLYLNVEIEENLPEKIVSDRQRIEQVIKNLISNAIKFTEEGGIKVHIKRPVNSVDLSRCGLDYKKAIAIAVIDTGIGIPDNKQKLIFEAFQQADGATNRKFGGTGLGLSISRELAKILGGEIQLNSKVGEGSTFILYLPELLVSNEKKQEEIVEQRELKNKIEKTPQDKSVLKKKDTTVHEIRDDRLEISKGDKSILIIEDDPKFSKILFDFTREQGFKCLIAGDGEAGLQMAIQYIPSAIVLDVGLPRMDGWTVMERLKENPETRHIPVYFISGQDKKMDAMKMGAIGYLTKPVNVEDINNVFAKIEETISKDIKKLLVVEDDETMRNSILELIGNSDTTITTAEKGEDALSLLNKEDFDCIVLDLGLSDISGFDLLKKISVNKKISHIPVIVYTGKDLSKKEEITLRKYAESIIIKGAKSPDRLLDEVSLFLHRVESNLPSDQKTKISIKHDKEDVFKDKKILVADDDIRNIFALSSILEEKEIQVSVAENGIEVLEVLEKDPKIDLILMDIMMPEMDGYETMENIRKQKKYEKLPIIALTAKAMKGDRQKCIDAGANDYLSKPVDIEKMLSILRVWLYR